MIHITLISPIITSKEVTEKVQHALHYGAYDEHHDWSPSYDFVDRVFVLRKLLNDRNTTDDGGKKVILEFARELITQGASQDPRIMQENLVDYEHIPEVKKILWTL